ncbi:MAG TPA: hypothetical protein VKR42_05780, partial [Ktedonobacteraceae bacterium]|nr:hypothetical protein [Ktedonobacteraceae bacterium]
MQDPYNDHSEHTVPYQPQPTGMQFPLHTENVEHAESVENVSSVGNADGIDNVDDTGTTAGQYQQPGNGFMPPPVYASYPSYPNTRRNGGGRTGRAVLLTLLLAIVLGALLFGAGWEYGRTATVANPTSSSAGALQQGSNTAPTVPALTGSNVDTVREAVVAKVRPAVV